MVSMSSVYPVPPLMSAVKPGMHSHTPERSTLFGLTVEQFITVVGVEGTMLTFNVGAEKFSS